MVIGNLLVLCRNVSVCFHSVVIGVTRKQLQGCNSIAGGYVLLLSTATQAGNVVRRESLYTRLILSHATSFYAEKSSNCSTILPLTANVGH